MQLYTGLMMTRGTDSTSNSFKTFSLNIVSSIVQNFEMITNCKINPIHCIFRIEPGVYS